MFGFPIGNGNTGYNDFVENFTSRPNSGFPNIQKREVFYTIKDGSWNDATIWQTASGRVGLTPGANDDVYIRHTMTLNAANQQCNNLFVSGIFKTDITSRGFTVNGNFKCDGILDLSTNNSGHTLFLNGLENRIKTYIPGTGSIINYSRGGDQKIVDIAYNNLTISGWGVKSPTANVVVNKDLNVNNSVLSLATISYFDLLCYDLTVNGATNINAANASIQSAVLRKTGGGGNILFVGAVTLGFRGVLPLDFSIGNPNVECRGGVVLNQNNLNNIGILSGTGTWSFTTNNQSITDASGASGGSYFVLDGNIAISPGITLTIGTSGTNFPTITCNGTINGQDSASNLINKGIITFTNQIAAESCMTTGIYDFGSNTNTIQYAGNYSATIPSYFTTFSSVTISGTGTKTLSVNTTLNGNLTLRTNGYLELSTYNFTVNGITTWLASNGQLKKSGAGNVLFVGKLTTIGNLSSIIDFSLGNPTVELRGGIEMAGGYNWATFKTGTGTWSFTTNNQSLSQNGIMNFDCPISIVGNISLTIAPTSQNLTIGINNSINGTVAGSTLVIGNNNATWNATLNLNVNTVPMSIGALDNTKTDGIIAYLFNGDYTLPYSSYNGLIIGGTGTKTPSSDLTIGQRGLTINSGATLELSTFNLSNASTTNIAGTLLKTGAGTVLFTGRIQYSNNNGCVLDFRTGNPTVECRGGLGIAAPGSNLFYSGNGTWTFSTNNQSIQSGNATITFDAPVIISGAITVTNSFSSGTFSTLVFNNTVNGNNALSTLLNFTNCTINYKSSTQPMITGILDTSTNLNTFIYGNSNQDIKGSPTTSPKQVYRNLTLNGGGTKTLQGYVSVLNTYTLTSPATLALNGYTLTNP